MDTAEFRVPSSITALNFQKFFQQFYDWKMALSPEVKFVTFDFRETTYLEPIAMVFFSAIEDQFKKNGNEVKLLVRNDSKVAKVLDIFGLYKSKDVTALDDYYQKNLAHYAVKVSRILTRADGITISNQILPKILQRIVCTQEVKAGLNWALFEIIDNAGTHGYKTYDSDSYLGTVYVCAFSYKNHVEIAVFDLGQGIPASIISKYGDTKPKNTLLLSTKKGVSGHPNSSPGFGLFGAAQIAKNGNGTLYILSSGYGLRLTNKTQKSFSVSGFCGTLISLGLMGGSNFSLDSIIGRSADDVFTDFGIEY